MYYNNINDHYFCYNILLVQLTMGLKCLQKSSKIFLLVVLSLKKDMDPTRSYK